MAVPTITEARSVPADPGLLLTAVAYTAPEHSEWDAAADQLAAQLARERGMDPAEARRAVEASLPHVRVVMNPPGMWQELLDGSASWSDPVENDPGPIYGPNDEHVS